jgi:catalase
MHPGNFTNILPRCNPYNQDKMSNQRDCVANQLKRHGDSVTGASTATASNGCPVSSVTASLTGGPRGDIPLKDFTLIDHLAAFDRERIPERVVHAKGAGAFGYFEVTSPAINQYCKAKVFQHVGKRTPVAARFSTVGGESGSADTGKLQIACCSE